jgi:biopolymer transport protein ExbD
MRVSTSLAEINVVPLVDVMLVLLVIFMVAAPMMTEGFSVQLPQGRHASAISEPVTVTVPLSFRQDRRVRVAKETVRLDVLAERIKQALYGQRQQNVIIAADGGVTMQDVITVVTQLVEGGVQGFAIQIQPPTGR